MEDLKKPPICDGDHIGDSDLARGGRRGSIRTSEGESRPVLGAEVSADHITGEHMRHGARLIRWRIDKRPEDCTLDQAR